ncbi:hypothetical protein GQ457_15G011770 [Hibiscus cannabinus]
MASGTVYATIPAVVAAAIGIYSCDRHSVAKDLGAWEAVYVHPQGVCWQNLTRRCRPRHCQRWHHNLTGCTVLKPWWVFNVR